MGVQLGTVDVSQLKAPSHDMLAASCVSAVLPTELASMLLALTPPKTSSLG